MFLIFCMKKWDKNCIPKYHAGLRKHRGEVTWTSGSFHGSSFLLERSTDNPDCSYSDLGTWQIPLKNEQCKPVTLGKTTDSICCQWPNLSFQQNLEVWKPHTEVNSVEILKGFSCHQKLNTYGDIIECDFIIV